MMKKIKILQKCLSLINYFQDRLHLSKTLQIRIKKQSIGSLLFVGLKIIHYKRYGIQLVTITHI